MTSFSPDPSPAADHGAALPLLPLGAGFWPEIAHQLERIARTAPTSFDAIREILMDPQYVSIQRDINMNGRQSFGKDHAFFAGSGGDDTLARALRDAGWRMTEVRSRYHYVAVHPASSEALTYVEGDVLRGDTVTGSATE